MSFLRHPSKMKTAILKVERLNKNTYIMKILTKRNYYGSYIKIRQLVIIAKGIIKEKEMTFYCCCP